MKFVLLVLLSVSFVFCHQDIEAKKKPRFLLAGGAEWGTIHNKEIGKNFHQSGRSLKYYGEIIYRYNGFNNLVISGGYVMDSLNFRNTNIFPSPTDNGYYSLTRNNIYGLIKTESAFAGLAYLLSIGSNKLGFDLQFGISGKYVYNAVRYDMPDEVYRYALKGELQPFNVFLQPRLALKISYFRFGASYEIPLMDHMNHSYLLESRPDKPTGDLQGLRMDNPVLYLSVSMALPVDKAFQLLNNYVEKQLQ